MVKKNSLVYLFLVFLCFSSCKTMREIDTTNSRKEDCGRFIYCPATMILLTGDTIRGRFTAVSDNFYQVHENNDSNINRSGKENGAKDRYYPVSTWYKCFTPEEINTYTVNGKTFQTVIPVADKTGKDLPWNSRYIYFLQRLTPDSSRIQLYLSFTPHSHGDAQRTGWVDFIGDIVQDMVAPGYYTYYIHFPGETPYKVWSADQSPIGFETKRKMAELFSTCPELQSRAQQIIESSKTKDLFHAMLSKEELKYPKTIPAILALFKKYDDWCYRNKNSAPVIIKNE